MIDPYGPTGTQFSQRQGESLVEAAPVSGVVFSQAAPGFRLNTAWLWPAAAGADLPNPVLVLKEWGVI